MPTNPLFPMLGLPDEVIDNLRAANPWWEGRPFPAQPATRRHLVGQIHRRLSARLAPIVVVRGPRQIGKSVAQLQVAKDLLDEGVPPRHVFRVQFDELPSFARLTEPILAIVRWYETAILGRTLNEVAAAGGRTCLFFDEVQNLPHWAPQLKNLVDLSTTQVVVTGSSALRIEYGRDSLAGRITTVEAGVLSLTEVAMLRGIPLGEPVLPDNGLGRLKTRALWDELRDRGAGSAPARDLAFAAFAERGGYPIAHLRRDVEWHQIADQLNETVVRRVIQHDLRIGDRGRKRDAALLEDVFRMACRYVGQTPRIDKLAQEIRDTKGSNVGVQRVEHYLRFLSDSLLVRLVEPLELLLKRRRSGRKLCLADHALRASWLQEPTVLAPDALDAAHETVATLAGRVADGVVGATLSSIPGLDTAWVPETSMSPEIDYVVTIGESRIPIEVKYQRRIDPVRDVEALARFLDRPANGASFGVLVTRRDGEAVRDKRVVVVPLSSLLLLR